VFKNPLAVTPATIAAWYFAPPPTEPTFLGLRLN
jgi:hypothetical protein